MRLTCPNCDAQYEVDPGMIPVSGRDVQCSSCGKTWFQGPMEALAPEVPLESVEAEAEAEAETDERERSGSGLDEDAAAFFEGRVGDTEFSEDIAEPGVENAPEDDAPTDEATSEDLIRAITAAAEETSDVDDVPEAIEDHISDEVSEPATYPSDMDEPEPIEAEAEPEPIEAASEPEEDVTFDDQTIDHADDDEITETEAETLHEDEDFAPPPPPKDRQTLDSNVLGILRAEAEREIAQRRAEESGLVETQPDLGLSEPTNRRSDPEDVGVRTARLRGTSEETRDESRQREMLPDIDDINASLTATSDRPADEAPPVLADTVLKRRAGFRVGFAAVMIAVVALIVIYLNAPQIARAMPSLETPLASYVDWANSMRLGLDGFLSQTVDTITGAGSNPS